MKNYPPNFFEKKDFLNEKSILEIKNSHDTIVPIIVGFDEAIMNSRINIKLSEQEKVGNFQESLKNHRRQCIKYINNIEQALDNYLNTKKIGYIHQANDIYRFLKRINEPLLHSQFSEVSKISKKIINMADNNLERLKKIK